MVSLLLLVACAPGPPSDAFVAPMDGQTGVPSYMPLMIRGVVDVPAGYPVGDLVRVVDVDVGSLVDGRSAVRGDAVLFYPDEAWALGRRFAWVVSNPEPVPHGPEPVVAEHLLGTAVFDTSDELTLLGVSVDPDGLYAACLLFSRPLNTLDAGDLRVVVDGVQLEGITVDYATDALMEPGLLSTDPGVGYACLLGTVMVPEGAVVRVWWGDAGPWSEVADGASLEQIAWSRRRGSNP